MSEVLKKFPARPRALSYPWTEWFSGKVYKLTKGVDFHCQTNSLRLGLYKKARDMKVKITVMAGDDYLVVQALK